MKKKRCTKYKSSIILQCALAHNFLQQAAEGKRWNVLIPAAVIVRAGEVKLADPGSYNAGVFQLMLNITQCLSRQWSHAAPGVERRRVFSRGRRELGSCCHLRCCACLFLFYFFFCKQQMCSCIDFNVAHSLSFV